MLLPSLPGPHGRGIASARRQDGRCSGDACQGGGYLPLHPAGILGPQNPVIVKVIGCAPGTQDADQIDPFLVGEELDGLHFVVPAAALEPFRRKACSGVVDEDPLAESAGQDSSQHATEATESPEP